MRRSSRDLFIWLMVVIPRRHLNELQSSNEKVRIGLIDLDWSQYKALSDQPDYWSNWMLDQCIDLLGQLQQLRLAGLLSQARAAEPLAVPSDYKGPLRMHHLNLSPQDASDLYTFILAARDAGLSTPQTQKRIETMHANSSSCRRSM